MRLWPVLLLSLPCFGSLTFNTSAVDASFFNLTQFASLSLPNSMQQLSDGSLAVLSSASDLSSGSIVRLVDANHDGVADGPGTVLYSTNSGPLTGFVKVGDYYAVGNLGDHTITLLQPGATPADTMTAVGTLQFTYTADWEHNNVGMAVRPGSAPGTYDLVVNIGSEFDHQLSTDTVGLSGAGLLSTILTGDSLYTITIDETGATPTASHPQMVVTGIRNVIGMQFDAAGNFYFADNAIDGTGPQGDEPPQADELNYIPAANFGTLANFGYPTCYIQYRTGTPVDTGGGGCVQPLVAFQPLDNGTPLGSESEGPGEIALSPSSFPAGFNDGVFVGFAGKPFIGPTNEENAIVYYDFGTGQYIHFTENSLDGVGRPVGLLSTSDALFVSDILTGQVYEITAAVPEPSTIGLCSVALLLGWLALRRRQRGVRQSELR
ncbi:MAG TPA: PEP-CTERM sorting domain-containing protein [Bryobacteraceae bacterium]|jgi:glucose/arabinose dehydrogenase